MKRTYTLRRLFVDGIHGQADLDEAIREGNLLTRAVSPPSPPSG